MCTQDMQRHPNQSEGWGDAAGSDALARFESQLIGDARVNLILTLAGADTLARHHDPPKRLPCVKKTEKIFVELMTSDRTLRCPEMARKGGSAG